MSTKLLEVDGGHIFSLQRTLVDQRLEPARGGGRQSFDNADYNSSQGMSTRVWGPSAWHFLHTVSFNYPVSPTLTDIEHYKAFVQSLGKVLPCGHCRDNLPENLKQINYGDHHFKSRDTFSHMIYELHEQVNMSLGKESGLTYKQVRDLYEHFRSRCSTTTATHKGCTDPLDDTKKQCLIKIVPLTSCKPGTPTIQVDSRLYPTRLSAYNKQVVVTKSYNNDNDSTTRYR